MSLNNCLIIKSCPAILHSSNLLSLSVGSAMEGSPYPVLASRSASLASLDLGLNNCSVARAVRLPVQAELPVSMQPSELWGSQGAQ